MDIVCWSGQMTIELQSLDVGWSWMTISPAQEFYNGSRRAERGLTDCVMILASLDPRGIAD